MDIVGVVSNHPDLRSLVEWHQIPFHHLPITADTRPQQGSLSGRCINIHHSFLPSFKGARPYHQA